jgi:hypothetical protein
MNQPSYQDLYYRAEQSERDALIGNFNAADKEVELASRDLAEAQMRGDTQRIADANARLSQATYQRETLQGGIQTFDEQHPPLDRGNYQYQQQPQQSPNAQQIINSMTSLIPEERQWLMQHPELVTTQEGQLRLQAAWYESQQKGIQRGSDEYFDLFNDRFGYAPQANNYSGAQSNSSQNYVVGGEHVQRQYQQPSKPYTPEMPRVTLTEKEAAKISGVDMATYKANQKKLRDLKALGYYSDR